MLVLLDFGSLQAVFCLKGLLIIWEINGLIHFIHPILLLTDHKMFLKVECNVNGGIGLMVWLSCLGIPVVLPKNPFLFGALNSSPKVSSVRGTLPLAWMSVGEKFPYAYLINGIYLVSKRKMEGATGLFGF